MSELGRGAFTSVGKDNGLSYYGYRKGKPADGSSPEKGFNYEAVNLGVLSIEKRLVELGYNLKVDGIFGPHVRDAVKDFQGKVEITQSGDVGYQTGPALFHGTIAGNGESFNFNPAFIWGIMKQESGGDPGAVGYYTPGDRGLYQYNTLVHDITYAQAHDHNWATEAVFSRFNNAWKKYRGKGEEMRTNCSIAQHNAPAWADEWFDTGSAPNTTILQYVGRVQSYATTF